MCRMDFASVLKTTSVYFPILAICKKARLPSHICVELVAYLRFRKTHMLYLNVKYEHLESGMPILIIWKGLIPDAFNNPA